MTTSVYRRIPLLALALMIGACSGMYYDAMEKVGFPKRDILVDRIEGARDAQGQAQEEFKSALEEFRSVVNVKETSLAQAYDSFNAAYEDSKASAERVSKRIDSVESVAEALFVEWEEELDRYENPQLRRQSAQTLEETREKYEQMIASMHRAEKSMQPVLEKFEDNVLFLKHNLNAQAIGALRTEFAGLKDEIDQVIEQMTRSIESSNAFISELQRQ